MLHLARGQLNRAYRLHGLVTPNPLPAKDWYGVNPTELDDPAAMGVERARAKFQGAFAKWEKEMPAKLVDLVLDILRKTHAALLLQQQSDASKAAVLEAYDLLQTIVRQTSGSMPGTSPDSNPVG